MTRKLIQEVRCSRCKRVSEVDVSKSKDPFTPIGLNWTCGKDDCAKVAAYARITDQYRATSPAAADEMAFTTAKPPKYRNEPTVVDGIKFASKKEADRYAELKLMERGGMIRDLRTHERFNLEVNGVDICAYIADFAYFKNDGSVNAAIRGLDLPGAATMIVEDVKGRKSSKDVAYRLFTAKKRLMKAVLGIDVVEV